MDIRALRYFVAVAETGHMTRAAEQLGIQQPPLSQQIKSLERELGVLLFRRHPRGVALTDAGRLFQAEALRMLQDMEAMKQRMARVATGQVGTLAVGFTSSAAAHRFMPEALRAFRRAHPGVELQLREDNAAELTEALAAGRLHCGLLRVPVARPEGLVFETLLREPVLVAMPSDHRFALARGKASRPLPLAKLCEEGIILVRRPGAPGLYADLLALCHAKGLRPRVVAEVDRMMTNLNLVAAGVGLSVVPASMTGVHAHAIAYARLADGGQLDAPLTLVSRAGEDNLPAQHFAALLRAREREPGVMSGVFGAPSPFRAAQHRRPAGRCVRARLSCCMPRRVIALAEPPGAPDRGLPARRRERRHGARAGRPALAGAGRAGAHREPRRRGRQHGHGCARARRARRLHPRLLGHQPAHAASADRARALRPAARIAPVASVMRTPVLVVGTPAFAGRGFGDLIARRAASRARCAGPPRAWPPSATWCWRRCACKAAPTSRTFRMQGGGPQLNDALSGQFEVLSTNVAAQQLQYIEGGRFQALAVGAPARIEALPAVPTLAELGFEKANRDSLFGIFAPARTPAAVVQRLNAEINRVLRSDAVRERLRAAYNLPAGGSIEDFAHEIAVDRRRNRELVAGDRSQFD
jgi:DNA-binding transcriptional LysR family regulator/tripartite-type tricarboxylate transporter receptor subunit TctC